ncbi:glycosyltransferase family 4 protein [Pseudoxanthomonas sp. PXM02]|uniref:glycosyltransferase family 4 protein n=1 Tax=Pseudoxanthomonas sp. PXM02 TaxID=2769294 RepID=UPI0017819F74|nr:glycosyltransferase family 4 protein [Pseudoxanthomonas sp. PXM02]MBD9478923.1 glycosyltransferase family 4 protein [Pseudoxanthomonas sp. PXM02]
MKFILFANTDWYLYNFRLSTARALQARGVEVVMVSPPGDFGPRFAQHGVRWVPLRMQRASLNPLREAGTMAALVALLREERPDLLHSFTLKCAVYGALAARAAKVPAYVNAVTGLGYVFASDRMKARVLRPLVSTLMRVALGSDRSRVILQNPDDAQAFHSLRLAPPQHIRLIRSSGVDITRFNTEGRGSRDDGNLRVLLAARLLKEKGVHEFADASARLRAEGRDVQFLLAGMPDEGNPSSVTREQVEQWQAQGLVRWLGHVDDMPALLREVDVMALPSYYREGVPKSLIEAAACSIALVTTDLPGCREVVTRDGHDGLHVVPRSAESLAQVLARLDDDRTLLRVLGARAREKALADFDERVVISRTCDVYDELLPQPLAMAA